VGESIVDSYPKLTKNKESSTAVMSFQESLTVAKATKAVIEELHKINNSSSIAEIEIQDKPIKNKALSALNL
jgi:hypothetical protein